MFIVALFFVAMSCAKQDPSEEMASIEEHSPELARPLNERVVVANRGSGTISVIDAKTDVILGTYPMPNNGEPMYAVHVKSAKSVFVGDRANNQVVAFDEDNFSVKGTVPCGNGVFHMWASRNGNQLWVNNDIDNTTTIINPNSMMVKGTAQTPADLVNQGGKPHDVFVDPGKKFAYVSVLGVSGSSDYVVKYNTNQYQEVGRIAVGKDPHLFASAANNKLYVVCQSGEVYDINRSSFTVSQVISFSGAHGVNMSGCGNYLYATDLPGNRVGVINTNSNTVIGTPVTSPFPIPHNIAINSNDSKIYVTHSGATADKLSIYATNPTPTLLSSLTLGTNPFGLTYYKYR